MAIKTIKNLKNISEKTILLRTDWNVPYKRGVSDDTKIEYSLPTIKYLMKNKARIVILSHFGRPKGRKDKKYSLKKIVSYIQKKYKLKLNFCSYNLISENDKIMKKIKGLKHGEILVLENIRFYKEEEKNDLKFAKILAGFGDIFVNDAFGVCHRKHASIVAVTKYLQSYAGLLIENELMNLKKALNPKNPSVAVMGGIKIETKLKLINKIGDKYSKVLLGVGLSKAFWHSKGIVYGKKDIKFSDKEIKMAKKLYQKKKKNIILPEDVIVVKKLSMNAKAHHISIEEVVKSDIIVDIGPETIKKYSEIIKKSKSIIWNGPMGWYEFKPASYGSKTIARIIGIRSKGKAFGVVGGGETIDCLKDVKYDEYVDFISSGGGAMLEYLQNQDIPGIKALKK